MTSNGPSDRNPTLRRIRLFLSPGIGIKRWLAVGVVGVLLVALGIAFAVSVSLTNSIVEVGRTLTFGGILTGVQRGAIFGVVGVVISGTSA